MFSSPPPPILLARAPKATTPTVATTFDHQVADVTIVERFVPAEWVYGDNVAGESDDVNTLPLASTSLK
eukprot:jgi/Chlat1/1280/Chrsp117S01711